MKKNIIIVLLAVVSICSVTYGYLLKQKLNEYEAVGLENAELAKQAEIRARKLQEQVDKQKN